MTHLPDQVDAPMTPRQLATLNASLVSDPAYCCAHAGCLLGRPSNRPEDGVGEDSLVAGVLPN